MSASYGRVKAVPGLVDARRAAYRRPVSSAGLDRLLAILLVVQLASGLLTLRSGVPTTAPLFWLHGLVGGALLIASVEKLRRSIGPAIRRRRWRRLVLGAVLSLLVAAALAGGFLWVASGRILTLGPWTILTLHVWAALAVIPVLAVHLLPRRWRVVRGALLGQPMTRRTLLTLGVVTALGAAAWGGANLLDRLQGGIRRFTGSRWLPAGGIPPPTTFYGEPAPKIESAAWQLNVTGKVASPRSLDAEALAQIGVQEREAVLDCTSGWAMRTRWQGTPLRDLLTAVGADPATVAVIVRSATGWAAHLPSAEIGGALLATHVAGEPLPTANGAPLRLVAPDRRGLDWVKWVVEIEVV